MKKLAVSAFLGLSILFNSSFAVNAAEKDFSKPLPQSLTEQEQNYLKNNFDQYLKDKYKPFENRVLRAPEGVFWTPGEFEKCEGICFSWAGYSGLMTQLIADSSQHAKVFVAAYSENGLKDRLVAAGAKAENLQIVKADLDSVWMRDFGPFFIYKSDRTREIIDCVYNRPRPNDDKFPQIIGKTLNIKVNPCKLILPGGNFQTDGHGVAIVTDVVFDPSQGGDPNMTREQFEKYMKDYFGMKKVIILKQMKRDGTGHVDMFSKLLDDKNFIVGEYKTPADGAPGNYEILAANVKTLENETNGLGEKFIVTRIPMPKYDGTSYSHTNSVFVNDLVMVPVYNKGTDDEALGIYRKILPNHTVKGYDCRDIITANGAIHCITQLVMADPLQIKNARTRAVSNSSFDITFNIDTKRVLNNEKVLVHWSNDKSGTFVPVTAGATNNPLEFKAEINGADSNKEIYYFITVEALDGTTARMPINQNEFMTYSTK
ncbi:MAG: agmatine deiminase family protein [Candidatus Wallbacteria bacterium]